MSPSATKRGDALRARGVREDDPGCLSVETPEPRDLVRESLSGTTDGWDGQWLDKVKSLQSPRTYCGSGITIRVDN